MQKLINLKNEAHIVAENILLYRAIQEEFVRVLQIHPTLNQEFVLNSLCDKADMKREDFNFINETEVQYYKDLMNIKTRKK